MGREVGSIREELGEGKHNNIYCKKILLKIISILMLSDTYSLRIYRLEAMTVGLLF